MPNKEEEIKRKIGVFVEMFKEKDEKYKSTVNDIETYSQVFEHDFEHFKQEQKIADVDEAKVRFYLHEFGIAHVDKDGKLTEIDNSAHFAPRHLLVSSVLDFKELPEGYNSALSRAYAEVFEEDFKNFKAEHGFKDNDIAIVAFYLNESGEVRFENDMVVSGHSVPHFLDKLNLVHDYAVSGKYSLEQAKKRAADIGKARRAQENEDTSSSPSQKNLEDKIKKAVKSYKKDKNSQSTLLTYAYANIFKEKFDNFKTQQKIRDDDEARVRFFMHESGQARVERDGKLTVGSDAKYFDPRMRLVQRYVNNEISLGAALEEANSLEARSAAQQPNQPAVEQPSNQTPPREDSPTPPPQNPPRQNNPTPPREDAQVPPQNPPREQTPPQQPATPTPPNETREREVVTETLRRSRSRKGVDFEYGKTSGKTDLIYTNIKIVQKDVEDRYQMLGVTSKASAPLIDVRESGKTVVSISDNKTGGLQLFMTQEFVDSLRADNPQIDFGELTSVDGGYVCEIARAGITKNNELEVADVHAENKNFSLIVSAIQSKILDSKDHEAQNTSSSPRNVIVSQRFFDRNHQGNCILSPEQDPIYSTLMIENILLERTKQNERSPKNRTQAIHLEVANNTILHSFPLMLEGETEPQYPSILERDGKHYLYVQTRNDSIRAPKFYEIRACSLQETNGEQRLCVTCKNSSGNVDLMINAPFDANQQFFADIRACLEKEFEEADALAKKNNAPNPRKTKIGGREYNVHDISHQKVENLVSFNKAAELEREIDTQRIIEHNGDPVPPPPPDPIPDPVPPPPPDPVPDPEQVPDPEPEPIPEPLPKPKKMGDHKYEILNPNENLFKGLLILGILSLVVSMFVPFAYVAFFGFTFSAFTYQVIQPLNQIKKLLNKIDLSKMERTEERLESLSRVKSAKATRTIGKYSSKVAGYERARSAVEERYASDPEKLREELEKFDKKRGYVRAKRNLVKAQNQHTIDENSIYGKQLNVVLKENKDLTPEQIAFYEAQRTAVENENSQLKEQNKRANLQQVVQNQDLEALLRQQQEAVRARAERQRAEQQERAQRRAEEARARRNTEMARLRRARRARARNTEQQQQQQQNNTRTASNGRGR